MAEHQRGVKGSKIPHGTPPTLWSEYAHAIDSIKAGRRSEVPLPAWYFEVVPVKENRHGLTDGQYSDMLEMLNGLSAAERKTLADPDFITEDEADLIYHDRAMADPAPSISLDELLAENGIPQRRPGA